MEILKILTTGFFAIILLILVIPIFTKKILHFDRSIIINRPLNEVFDYVIILKNQDYFSVWASKDSEMKKEYFGEDGTIGFISAWDSQMKDVGKGEQEIVKIIDGKRIDYELRFLKPFKTTNQAAFLFKSISESQTEVTWEFQGKMKYPLNLFLLLRDIEGLMGKDLQDGLNKLKILLEK